MTTSCIVVLVAIPDAAALYKMSNPCLRLLITTATIFVLITLRIALILQITNLLITKLHREHVKLTGVSIHTLKLVPLVSYLQMMN